VTPKLTYRHWYRSATEATAVAATIAVLTGCSVGGNLNGHPASTLSTDGPASTRSSGVHGSVTASGPSSPQGPTATANPRPRQRPNSVSRLFTTTPIGAPCKTVDAGSTSTFTVQRLTFQSLCFTGLNVSIPPSIVVVTPSGMQETAMLAEAGIEPGEWDWVIHSLPGQGPEASLGEYAFRVITAVSGATGSSTTGSSTTGSSTTGSSTTGSSTTSPEQQTTTSPDSGVSPSTITSPPSSEIAISGHFTVVPAASPMADLSPSLLSAGSQLQIAFSGFPSASIVYVTVYGPGVGTGAATTYPLLADVPGLTTDQNGEAVTRWTVPSGTAVGRYAFWFDPPLAGCRNPCGNLSITP
jgi:hypothetical protein